MPPRIDLKSIPAPVIGLLWALTENDYQAYIVGGTSRALVTKKKPKDWDISTDAKPNEVKDVIALKFRGRVGYTVVETGLQHGSISLFIDSMESKGTNERSTSFQIDITTFRIEEGYSDGRHPDYVQFVKDVTEDLKRRDFTFNAIAISWPECKIIDPCGGRRDIRGKVIRAVGDPSLRFEEDPLRMLRAIRFYSEMGFCIESATYRAILRHANLINTISRERIRDEIIRIVMGGFAEEALYEMANLGLIDEVLPEMSLLLPSRPPYC